MSSHPDRVRRNYKEAVQDEHKVPTVPADRLAAVTRDVASGYFAIMTYSNIDGAPGEIILSQEDIYTLIRLVHGQTTGEPT